MSETKSLRDTSWPWWFRVFVGCVVKLSHYRAPLPRRSRACTCVTLDRSNDVLACCLVPQFQQFAISARTMPKVPIFRLRTSDPPSRPDLQYYGPTLAFADLRLGVDNLRYDVFLSPRITADLSFYLARYIARIGEVESLNRQLSDANHTSLRRLFHPADDVRDFWPG